MILKLLLIIEFILTPLLISEKKILDDFYIGVNEENTVLYHDYDSTNTIALVGILNNVFDYKVKDNHLVITVIENDNFKVYKIPNIKSENHFKLYDILD